MFTVFKVVEFTVTDAVVSGTKDTIAFSDDAAKSEIKLRLSCFTFS